MWVSETRAAHVGFSASQLSRRRKYAAKRSERREARAWAKEEITRQRMLIRG